MCQIVILASVHLSKSGFLKPCDVLPMLLQIMEEL
jgi:hypothetical protein